MQTKLTLRLEKHLIEQAKAIARQQNKSLSQIVEEYFTLLSKAKPENASSTAKDLPPITRSLLGILRDTDVDEQDYRTYLESKYQ
jgi:hypothetical protein